MQLRKENQDAFTKRHGIKLGFMSAFVKASAYALTQQPTVNAVIEGQEIIYRDYVDISVAVATPKVRSSTTIRALKRVVGDVGSAKRRGLGCVSSLAGSAWL